MSTPHDPPLSRRAARRAELVAQGIAPEPAAAPEFVPEPAAAPEPVPGPATPPPSAPEPLVEPPTAAGSGARLRRRDFRPRAEPAATHEPPADERADLQHLATDERASTSAQVAVDVNTTDSLASKFDTVLDYRTQYPELAQLLAAPQPAPTLQTEASSLDGLEHNTMSRRDMRAARQRFAPEQREEPVPENVPPDADADAEVADVEPVELVEPDEPDEPDEAVEPDEVDVYVEVVDVEVVDAVGVDVVEVDVEVEVIVEAELELELELEPFTPHWSDGIHDTDDPFENTFSREVGLAASSTHTNALVLPEMPSVNIGGPVSGTGEIIITGMIDLSTTIAVTGVRPAVHESPGLDDFFDDFDREVAPQDSAPVSALDAVGSYATPLGLLNPSPQPARKTLTTVLIASTVGMAAVAIGLFVVAAVNGLF